MTKKREETSTATIEAKEKALSIAIGNIEKQFGKGAITTLGTGRSIDIDTIPTGSLSLDIATGVGGIPRGRIIEVYGVESGGKTTLSLHMVAEAQKLGGRAAFIDAEHALDPSYAKALGVDIDTLLLSQPDSGEQALEICEALARSGAVDIIVIDSVAALVPQAEIDGAMGDAHMALQARLMSQALRKLAGIVNKTNTCLVFINQIREKVGIMFGSNETTSGGRSLKFYATMRMEVRRIEAIKDGSDFIGNRTRVKIVKNKVAPPFKQAEFDLMFGKGISASGDILDCGIATGIIEKAGSWYSYGETRIGQGRENVKIFLEDNPDIMEEIREKVTATLFQHEDELMVDEDGVVIEKE